MTISIFLNVLVVELAYGRYVASGTLAYWTKVINCSKLPKVTDSPRRAKIFQISTEYYLRVRNIDLHKIRVVDEEENVMACRLLAVHLDRLNFAKD